MRTNIEHKMANPNYQKWLTAIHSFSGTGKNLISQWVEWCPHTDSNRGPTDYKLAVKYLKVLILLNMEWLTYAKYAYYKSIGYAKRWLTFLPVKRFVFPHKSTHVDNLTIHDESKIFGPKPSQLHPQCSYNTRKLLISLIN